jgi:hypothetical protein
MTDKERRIHTTGRVWFFRLLRIEQVTGGLLSFSSNSYTVRAFPNLDELQVTHRSIDSASDVAGKKQSVQQAPHCLESNKIPVTKIPRRSNFYMRNAALIRIQHQNSLIVQPLRLTRTLLVSHEIRLL